MNANNQLKLNLNAVVDNLNLVNIVHKPEPILIEKISNENSKYKDRNSYSDFNFKNHQNNEFELIDENKLSIYSYLVQRELKTKEWLSKYDLNNFSASNLVKPESDLKNKVLKQNETKLKKEETKILKNEIVKQNQLDKKNSSNKIVSNKNNYLNDFKKCCEDLLQTIENLSKNLSEFKNDRLKIVFNDPIEEEKQNRIQSDQIKYLSRSMYNFQNQISTVKTQFNQNFDSKKSNSKLTILTRFIHIMRQVIKSIVSFSDLYPYRPDNSLITEKICFQFFKHLNSCVDSFTSSFSIIFSNNFLKNSDEFNYEKSVLFKNNILSILSENEKFFPDLNQAEAQKELNRKKNTEPNIQNKKTNSLVKIIRTSRSSEPNTNQQITSIKTKFDSVDSDKNQKKVVRIEISPPRRVEKQKYSKKKIQTARLFPTNLKQKIATNKHEIPEKDTNISIKRSQSSYELNNKIEINQKQISAFRHLSSPKLRKSSKSRSRSRERSSSYEKNPIKTKTYSNESLHSNYSNSDHEKSSRSHSEIRNKYQNKFMESTEFEKKKFRPILKSPTTSTKNLINKLDLLKEESDLIRNKYEKLTFEKNLIHSFSTGLKHRRPYEECYLKNDKNDLLNEYESKINFNTVYKPLNKPNLEQLKRVIKYAENFDKYNQKTSVTNIGDSKFDDFELFELLSNELFDEFSESIYQEVEHINEELASNLIKNEFNATDLTSLSSSSSSSFTQKKKDRRNFNQPTSLKSPSIKYSVKTDNKYSSFQSENQSEDDMSSTEQQNQTSFVRKSVSKYSNKSNQQILTEKQYSSFQSIEGETLNSILD